MITLRLVCAAAAEAETSATQTAMNGMILFRPMAMIDPLVVIWLLMICGWFRLVAFRRQESCGTNGAYSSPWSVSQGKTSFWAVWSAVPKRSTSIADVIIRGCLLAAENHGNVVRRCCLP